MSIDFLGRKQVRGLIISLALVGVLILGTAATAAAGHHSPKADKQAILLVTFGTSNSEAAKVFELIDAMARKRFPDTEIRWAYTSVIIRKKLAKQGKLLDAPVVALAKLADEGYTQVAVQSLHVIPGQEFDDLRAVVASFAHHPEGFTNVVMGMPLLTSVQDMERVARAVLKGLPAERKNDEAVVLMGHGTHHRANAVYPAMAFIFSRLDPRVFVGTVEGYPELDLVREQIRESGVKTAWLVPLMSVAGDHALNDMAGEEDDSWKSILTGDGIVCRPVLKGMAADPAIVDVWLDHLAEAVKHLN